MYSAVKEIQAEAENGCLEPYKGVATFEGSLTLYTY